jgi:aryl-alcohol dehydrogenase-like predicted oxidoreductase
MVRADERTRKERNMQQRRLGRSGPEVSAIGLGVMGMSEFYGTPDGAECIATLERAIELGVTFWDTADAYGSGHNEELIGGFIGERGWRDRIVLATKFGFVREGGRAVGISGKPEYVRGACDGSLRRLGFDCIDLYYQHRIDSEVPVEETVGAMSELVKAGKVKALGLSEVSAETLRRAHAVHPIAAVQTEYSLWSRDPERAGGILEACRELGVGFVPYSPLGRGFLTGKLKSLDALGDDDFRLTTPRFERENFERNLRLMAKVEAIAKAKGCSPGQLALAWLLAQGDFVVPIPGTKRRTYLEDNAGGADVRLDAKDLAALDEAMPRGVAAGERYGAIGMALADR